MTGSGMKVVVTGAVGQLGYDVMQRLKECGIVAVGMDLPQVDITDKAAVIPNSVHPHGPLIRQRQMGMYEPRIIRKIEQWSKI